MNMINFNLVPIGILEEEDEEDDVHRPPGGAMLIKSVGWDVKVRVKTYCKPAFSKLQASFEAAGAKDIHWNDYAGTMIGTVFAINAYFAKVNIEQKISLQKIDEQIEEVIVIGAV